MEIKNVATTHTLRHNFRSRSSITFVQLELYTAESALSFYNNTRLID